MMPGFELAEAGFRSDAEAPSDWLYLAFHPRRGGVQRTARWKRATGSRVLRRPRQKRAVGDCLSWAHVFGVAAEPPNVVSLGSNSREYYET